MCCANGAAGRATRMSDNDETFLSRWSRRKRGLEPEATPQTPADEAAAAPVEGAEQAEPVAAKDTMLTEADFADVNFEALDFGSDYARFMGKNVPDAIRNRALRKLWVSDPVLANMDGLHDYFGDYTDDAVAIKPGQILQTAYKYGQGFLSDEEAAVWDKLGKPQVVADAAEVNEADAAVVAVVEPIVASDGPAAPAEVAIVEPTADEPTGFKATTDTIKSA